MLMKSHIKEESMVNAKETITTNHDSDIIAIWML